MLPSLHEMLLDNTDPALSAPYSAIGSSNFAGFLKDGHLLISFGTPRLQTSWEDWVTSPSLQGGCHPSSFDLVPETVSKWENIRSWNLAIRRLVLSDATSKFNSFPPRDSKSASRYG